ncbi:hypothetical protein QUB05_13600 [Microcoleus sp. F10-C6]
MSKFQKYSTLFHSFCFSPMSARVWVMGDRDCATGDRAFATGN